MCFVFIRESVFSLVLHDKLFYTFCELHLDFCYAAILEGKYSAAFTVDLMQKDMRLALALAKEHKQKMPITSASTEVSL